MIFIIIEANIFCYFEDYIKSIIKKLNNVEIININNFLLKIRSLKNRDKDKFIFIQKIPFNIPHDIIKQCYLINTEQLSIKEKYNNISKYFNKITIIDYSLGNLEYIKDNKSIYLPYQINNDEIYNYEKIYNCCMINSSKSIKRTRMITEINKKLTFINNSVNIISGFGLERDLSLFRHKILINIHFSNDYNVFEQFRCNRCIFNKIIVITEKFSDPAYELQDYMIICNYEEIPAKVLEVLQNYEYYYKKIFENFNIEDIEKKYKKIDENIFN